MLMVSFDFGRADILLDAAAHSGDTAPFRCDDIFAA